MLDEFAEAMEPYVDAHVAYSIAREAQLGAMLGLLIKKKMITESEYNEILEQMLTSIALTAGTVDPEDKTGD